MGLMDLVKKAFLGATDEENQKLLHNLVQKLQNLKTFLRKVYKI